MQQALYVLFISALPVVELRGAVPYGIISLGLSPGATFILAVLGNLIPVIFLLSFLGAAEKLCRKYSVTLNKLFDWWFIRIVGKHELKFKNWGPLALIMLVAVPFPMTGAWTGSAAAHLFKIKRTIAFFYITIGVIIAGGIVTALTITGTTLF